MIEENVLKKLLFDATELVKKLINGEMDIDSFITNYNNFYYYNALDGHEADSLDRELIKKYKKYINFHKDIQKNIIDKLYLGKSNYELYIKAGRILPDQALELINRVARSYDIDQLLQSLSQH